MSREVRYYKGKHKVAVLSESRGNWVVEALEPFEDEVYGKKIKVRVGEKRIVPPNSLFKKKGLPPPVKEHEYELKMEKKLKQLVGEHERKESKSD
jgi:hypothetical protein